MKRTAILLLLSSALCFGEDVTLTKSAVLKAERSIVALKAGTVVELVSRHENMLTIRYGKITGLIPANSIAGSAPAVEPIKKDEPAPAPVPPRKAVTNYGKAVGKARENVAKHDKNVVKPTNEILN